MKPNLRVVEITIDIPDELARKAKLVAAEQRTTMSNLVVKRLEHVLGENPMANWDRARNLFSTMDRLPPFSAQQRFKRNEAHAR